MIYGAECQITVFYNCETISEIIKNCSLLSQRHIMLESCAAPKRPSRHLQPSSIVKTNVSFVVLIKAFHLLPLGL